MKVSELIEILKTHNPDALVVVSGYESGFNDLNAIEIVRISKVEDSAWYDGNYQSYDDSDINAVSLT